MSAPWLDDGDIALYHGDALAVLSTLPTGCAQTCVTSPPYFALRDYGVPGQLGLEATVHEYVEALVAVFAEVWRVLRDDATLWLNLGDSFAGGGYANHAINGEDWFKRADLDKRRGRQQEMKRAAAAGGIKPKDLYGVPWRVAFALQEAGWYLRSDIIWAKPNPMPESVTDRPTKAHEYVFLLAKQPRYYYDADAVREGATWDAGRGATNYAVSKAARGEDLPGAGHVGLAAYRDNGGRNARSVWEIATQPTPEAHFATFPEALVRRCILAGTSEAGGCAMCGAPWQRQTDTSYENPGNRTTNGPRSVDRKEIAYGTAGFAQRLEKRVETTGWAPSCACGAPAVPQQVLDPFMGSGTTALVARKLGRRATGIDLSADYLAIAARRLGQQSLFAQTSGALALKGEARTAPAVPRVAPNATGGTP